VTKQQLSVQPARPSVTQAVRQPVRKRPLPVPGARLRKAVETVLTELGTDTGEQSLRRYDDVLRTALAWTAASGETCRIAPAVLAVRTARTRLRMAEPEAARQALTAARDGLHHVPDQRAAR
jgi:hypothetical protein